MAISTGISSVSVRVGLAVSAVFTMPPSFLIVTIARVLWLAARAARETGALIG